MEYFVTGATGFIGKRLVRKLLARPDSTVYFLTRSSELEKLESLYAFWNADGSRAIPVVGDLKQPLLGVAKAEQKRLKGKIDHFFHLAALYDLGASAEEDEAVNIAGTRHTLAFAEAVAARCFHHMSSIAAAGMFEGIFREDMFDEAENLDHPYYRTKHESEGIVRKECKLPWRIYRPGSVVGDSRTGEMDKIDGPYYFFKIIQKLRRLLPPWLPTIGIEGGRINIVPVDFVVDALDHIGHLAGQDGKCFHLTDPHPHRVGDVLAILTRAAHAPDMGLRINAALLGFIPKGVKKSLLALTPVRRIRNALMKDLGLPDDILDFVNYPTRFDCRETEKALAGSGIAVPPLESYAWRLWDYWERHLDPDLFVDRTLRGRVQGKVVLVTGGSSGIGKAVARKVAEAGAVTVIVARDQDKLAEAKREFEAGGLQLVAYSADISNYEECDDFVRQVTEEYGGVDFLVNNAGRSIRRAIENSFDRFHDFERCMQLNYFAAVRLTMGFLPGMLAKKKGHIINISSIGVLTNAPRFSAYVASKSALEAFSRCAASEFTDRGIDFTCINMPLVKTPMIAPTKLYQNVPTLTPEEAADLVVEAIIHKPVRIATRLGIFGQVVHAVSPKVAQIIMNTSFRMFPDSAAAVGQKEGAPAQPTADQIAFSQLMRGIHF
ncbi:MAG: short chain dehydrogenase [Candidatus Desulfobacillus denitrificans]|uniref:SDR family oxidoreductase n=1 Tax=Candidatus Desulfobacillus denitrificans TaxID=2608985 RepID=A0A809QZ63_9PROT|nr:SDR family oxidoreductase [Zoogloeaceae bacterium]MCZ2173453.1 SDR family oxidoreductase [Burkholderiales bacterium]BBO20703.1 SDR family oxidoreductase [Candidatus Desulfobacillus denitrificans]GIK44271.1 MAG: short chain dehydrogenase [Betaproteobacteria bacterium]GJQ55238.1 MAG: short chain dehydrogenase [Rhodocyclaceae bacterium]